MHVKLINKQTLIGRQLFGTIAMRAACHALPCRQYAGRKGIWPVKLSGGVVACYLTVAVARCRFAYGLADAAATHCELASVNPDWFYLPGFTFLVSAHPGNPRQSPGAVKWL